ncbi:PhzF family phenazine biosynthesis protein [Streptoalloteichus hindustanus]|nr:PhzF family phenazine biosynthesis protein [Streptoalloteichus hindustanus]
MGADLFPLRYDVVDVFTDRPFAGNPLAVVHGADGLPDEALRAVAREFNLSETVFPMRPTSPDAHYRLRIFTPRVEMPFAGHPSVGAAWVLARDGIIPQGPVRQECGIGLVDVTVDERGAEVAGGNPVVGPALSARALAAAAGLGESDVDAGVPAGVAGAGVDFSFLLVRPDAVARAVPDQAALRAAVTGRGLVVVGRRGADDFVVRMFRATAEGGEDAATGSAALALGAWLVDRGLLPAEGGARYAVHQGAEVGRPSTLVGRVRASAGRAERVWVRGGVVPVAAGALRVPPAR